MWFGREIGKGHADKNPSSVWDQSDGQRGVLRILVHNKEDSGDWMLW